MSPIIRARNDRPRSRITLPLCARDPGRRTLYAFPLSSYAGPVTMIATVAIMRQTRRRDAIIKVEFPQRRPVSLGASRGRRDGETTRGTTATNPPTTGS